MIDVKSLFDKMILTARRYGFRIDDEAESLAGIIITIGLTKWTEGGSATLDTYCIKIYLKGLLGLQKRNDAEYDDNAFIPRKLGWDKTQRLLIDFPEPQQSIAFAVWIEGITIKDTAVKYNFPKCRIVQILDEVARDLRDLLENVP